MNGAPYVPFDPDFFSATPPLTYNSTTGVFAIPQANGSTDGFLDSADWTTFNNKQNAITTGTTAQYFRGDLSLSTFSTDVRAQLSAGTGISYDSGTGVISSTVTPSTGADPTATVNGTATNGVATTFMRSDAAPALADPFTPADGTQNITGAVAVSGNVNAGDAFGTDITTIASQTRIDVGTSTAGNPPLIVTTNGFGTNTTPNTRGLSAVDFQTNRSAATQVASGAYSFISGGINNTASGARSVVLSGDNGTASGTNAVVSGGQGVASGDNSFAMGAANTAYAFGSTTLGMWATSDTAGSQINFNSANRIFAVGNGSSSGARSTAFDVFATASNFRVDLNLFNNLTAGDSFNNDVTTFQSQPRINVGTTTTGNPPLLITLGDFDGTPTAPNTRGIGAIDLQIFRGAATQVASGQYSVVISGGNSTVSGNVSGAFVSFGSTVSGGNSAAIAGQSNTVSGNWSGAFAGQSNTASAAQAVTLGGGSLTASGQNSAAAGINNFARAYGEFSIGTFGTDYTPGSASTTSSTNRLFNVGNGTGTGARANAFTIFGDASITHNGSFTTTGNMTAGNNAADINTFQARNRMEDIENLSGNDAIQIASGATPTVTIPNNLTVTGTIGPYISMAQSDPASVPSQSIFVDENDEILKFKDINGTVHSLY